MAYPIGIIPYSNMEPYRQLGAPEYCRFVPLVPKESIRAIKKGRVLAAAIPVGGLEYLADVVEPVGQFGIAARERSMSVLFFSRIPFASIQKKHKIRLTVESSSSVRLLYLLLGYKNGFNNLPRLSTYKNISGELVIGDKALIKSGMVIHNSCSGLNTDNNWSYITDLAELWYNIKGYPFVFARWVIRKDVPSVVKNSINQWLSVFRQREQELVNKAVKVGAKSLKINDFDMKLYFKVIKRTLNSDDLFGQKLFMDSFKKHRREPLFEN